MKIDTLLRLHNDLTIFNGEFPIVVQTQSSGDLIFRQLGKVVAIPYYREYYFSHKKVKLSILTSSGYTNLMKNLELLISSSAIKDDECGMIIGEYETSYYKCYLDRNLNGPQLFAKLEFITIKNYLLSKFYLRHAGLESKILLKSILNERRNSKSIENSSTS